MCKSRIYSLAQNKMFYRGYTLIIYSLSTIVGLLASLKNYVY